MPTKKCHPSTVRRAVVLCCGLAAFCAFPLSAGSSTIVVAGGCSLADAIRSANADMNLGGCTGAGGDETLVLDEDVVLSSADATSSLLFDTRAGLPDITSSMTIEAGAASRIERDTALDCERSNLGPRFRLLNVTGGAEVTLRGLTLTNGCAFGGGAVAVAHPGTSDVTFDTMTFSGNRVFGAFDANEHPEGVDARGGALLIGELVGGSVSIVHSELIGNRAFGGDICPNRDARGGALDIQADVGAVTEIRDTTFSGNGADLGVCDGQGLAAGGSIAVHTSSVVRLQSVHVASSLARASLFGVAGGDSLGGGVYTAPGSSVEIDDSSFIGNSALGGNTKIDVDIAPGAGSGEGLYLGGTAVVSSSEILDNTAVGGDGSDVYLGVPGRAGGLWMTSGTLRNVLIRGNAAVAGRAAFQPQDAYGGGLAVYGGAVDAHRVALVDNEARGSVGGGGWGGGSYTGVSPASLRLVSSTVSGNRAVGVEDTSGVQSGFSFGGGAAGGAVVLESSTVSENRAIAGPANGGGSPGQAAGGGVYADAEIGSSILYGNVLVDGDGVESFGDCDASPVSLGANIVGVPGTCSFNAAGDQVGVDPRLGALDAYGCSTALAGGACIPIYPLDSTSPAADRGSCPFDATMDGRGYERPWDLPLVLDFDDACDVGSFEIIDSNGDGQDDVVEMVPIFDDGFESGDTSSWSSSAP